MRRLLGLWFVPISRLKWGAEHSHEDTHLPCRSCLLVKCTSLLQSAPLWGQTVTAVLTPPSFPGPPSIWGNYVFAAPPLCPCWGFFPGNTRGCFVLNVLCLEHGLTLGPASFASIKTCWGLSCEDAQEVQASSLAPPEGIQVPRVPRQPTSWSRQGSRLCQVPTAIAGGVPTPIGSGVFLITQVDSADMST